jgi:hypothetical protein
MSSSRVVVNFGDPRLPDRFWSKVAPCPMTGCWLWTGSISKGGYAFFGMKDTVCYAHRVSYQSLVGVIPAKFHIDHLCRVRCCVNPAHLEPVTHAENLRRGDNVQSKKTHCPKGHPYSGDNLIMRKFPDGVVGVNRLCRACISASGKTQRGSATTQPH